VDLKAERRRHAVARQGDAHRDNLTSPAARNCEQQQGLESMPRREMISRRASRRLLSRMGKLSKDRSTDGRDFRNPPLWIHVSQAGKWLFSPREARKRAVIRLLDKVARAAQIPTKTES
jgi:hypothetical protein